MIRFYMVIEMCIMDYRLELLKEYRELLLNWDDNNMLYNSLKFYKLYNGDVEHSELVSALLGRENGKKKDIMTSWWKPTKYFLFRSIKGKRTELTDELLSRIPEKADVEELRVSLSKIRYQEENKEIEGDVIIAFMDFLKAIYSLGNMTNSAFTTTGGSLDNWDAKLLNIKSQIKADKWKEYIIDNCFQDFFNENDSDYETILPYWNYGDTKLAAATDGDWKEYFINVKDRIEKRNKRLKEKNIL